jgi:hypothetical protein
VSLTYTTLMAKLTPVLQLGSECRSFIVTHTETFRLASRILCFFSLDEFDTCP